jgi:predicted deacetylase
LASFTSTPWGLAARIQTALLKLKPGDEVLKACGIEGFVKPVDYKPVEDVLKSLRASPFRRLR